MLERQVNRELKTNFSGAAAEYLSELLQGRDWAVTKYLFREGNEQLLEKIFSTADGELVSGISATDSSIAKKIYVEMLIARLLRKYSASLSQAQLEALRVIAFEAREGLYLSFYEVILNLLSYAGEHPDVQQDIAFLVSEIDSLRDRGLTATEHRFLQPEQGQIPLILLTIMKYSDQVAEVKSPELDEVYLREIAWMAEIVNNLYPHLSLNAQAIIAPVIEGIEQRRQK